MKAPSSSFITNFFWNKSIQNIRSVLYTEIKVREKMPVLKSVQAWSKIAGNGALEKLWIRFSNNQLINTSGCDFPPSPQWHKIYTPFFQPCKASFSCRLPIRSSGALPWLLVRRHSSYKKLWDIPVLNCFIVMVICNFTLKFWPLTWADCKQFFSVLCKHTKIYS